MEVDIIEFFWPSNLSTKTGRARNKIDVHNTSIHRCFGSGRGGGEMTYVTALVRRAVKLTKLKKLLRGGADRRYLDMLVYIRT